MNAYLDSSVLLRIVFREPDPLPDWDQLSGVTSALTAVEAARTLDRETLLRTANDAGLTAKRREIADILRRVDTIEIDRGILIEAARPLPVVLGTLDAIHLASAVRYRTTHDGTLLFATHDFQLAAAARALHFEVLGA